MTGGVQTIYPTCAFTISTSLFPPGFLNDDVSCNPAVLPTIHTLVLFFNDVLIFSFATINGKTC